MLTIQNIEKIFLGHVRRLPGGGAGAGQVQREGARRPYCRHSYQCIHRWPISTSSSLMSMTSEDRRLRIVAIYKRHLQVGSTSSLSWPSLHYHEKFDPFMTSQSHLSTCVNMLPTMSLTLYILMCDSSLDHTESGSISIDNIQVVSYVGAFPRGPRRRNKINTTHHIPSLPQK